MVLPKYLFGRRDEFPRNRQRSLIVTGKRVAIDPLT
jgi:hypothetical protein